MKIIDIKSLPELREELSKHNRAYLLLYKGGSEQSDCALDNLKQAVQQQEGLAVFVSDVSITRDIHPAYEITTAPSLLEFESGSLKNVVKGCHQPEILNSIFDEAVYLARMEKEGKTVKRVTVYSTPTCSWCTTLKNYLRNNKIRFSDVDISRDPGAAQELMSRTGQQGVPQTEINGEWVVGFDQSKLDQMLEIKNHR